MCSTRLRRKGLPGISAEQRRKVRRATWIVSLIALAVYLGFIVMTLIRTHR